MIVAWHSTHSITGEISKSKATVSQLLLPEYYNFFCVVSTQLCVYFHCVCVCVCSIPSVTKEHVAPKSRRSSGSSVESRGSPSRPKTPSPPSAADWVQEYQGIRNAESMSSSPNVIIEEIYEDPPAGMETKGIGEKMEFYEW